MNELEKELNEVVSIVIECCVTTIDNGSYSITRNDVLGKSKKENASIVRNMLATHLIKDGFSMTTISLLMGRTIQSVRNMLQAHEEWMRNSNAYRIANAQVIRKLSARNSQENL